MMPAKVEKVSIKAVSVTVPGKKIRCSDFDEMFGTKEVARISRSSGISELRIVENGQTTSDLCVEAATPLLGRFKETIGGIVFVSQTPDYILPSTSSTLQNRLGLKKDIVTYDINSGCTGYVHGLYIAALMAASLNGDILVCAGDTISRHISEKDRSLKLIMGDAGSSTIVGPSVGKKMGFSFFTDGSRFNSLIIPAGGVRYPATEDNAAVTERENGNWRSDQHLFMDGLEIMKFALSDVVKLVQEAKSEETDIETYVFHQANKFIVEALAKNLKIPNEKAPLAVDGYGNTGSSSIPLAICHTFANIDNNPGKSLLVGFGVGLSAGTVIADLSDTMIYPVTSGEAK